MENLNFNKGYKAFKINDDENAVIRINTRDIKILERLKIASVKLKEIAKKYENLKSDDDNNVDENKIIKILSDCDKRAKEQIDYIFGEGVSKIVFGSMDCCSIVDGQPVFMGFLDAIIPIIEKDITGEQKLSARKIEKYTSQAKKFK